MFNCYGRKQRRLLSRKESTLSSTSTTSNTNTTMVREYFLPEIPGIDPKMGKKNGNALSITYYY